MLPYINTPFLYVEDKMGIAPEPLKLVFTFLLSYPLAGVLKRIPDANPWQKNLFTVAVSLFYLVGVFDLWTGIRTLFISAAGAYAIAKYIKGSLMPWIGFVFLMGYMSVSHVYRHYYGNPDIIDITGAQMVLVMKLTAFCWNVHDGRLPAEELEEVQRDRALKELPSLLDYTGYVLFFPSLMVGPAFDYVDYRRWLETSMFDVPPGTDPAKAPKTRKQRRIPRSGTPAAWKAAQGLFWVVAFLKCSGWFPDELLVGGAGSEQHGILRRILNMYLVNFTMRTKYYGVWFLAEGSCILSGIGYKGLNPKTGRPDWDRLQNVNPIGIETAQNSRAYLGNWNMNTNNWLRNYMYLRVTPKGKKPGFIASLLTFITSALWHGFEPGYYLSFVLAAFIQTCAKHTRRMIRPFFLDAKTSESLPRKIYYDVFTWFITQLAFPFVTTPFILLSLYGSFTAWKRVYFYCIVGVLFIMMTMPPKSHIGKYLKRKLVETGRASKKGPADKSMKDRSGGSKRDDAAADIATTATGTDINHNTGKAAGGRPTAVPYNSTAQVPSHSEDFDSAPSSVPNSPRAHRPAFLDRTGSDGYDAAAHGAMGIADDPKREMDEWVEQVKEEVGRRRARGMSVGRSLQEAVETRWGGLIGASVDEKSGKIDVWRRQVEQ